MSGVPHKSRGASTVLFYHYISELKRFGYTLFCLLLTSEDPNATRDVQSFRDELEEPGRCEVAVAALALPMRFARLSGTLQTAHIPDEISERVRRFDPQCAIFFDLAALALAAPISGRAYRVSWLGDLNFETIWLHALYDVKEEWRNVLRLPKIWLICRRWRSAYLRLLRDVDRILVASASSVQRLRHLGLRAVYCPYPWPIDAAFRPAARRPRAKQPTFLFCGTLTGLGSRSALHYLLDKLYPRLVERFERGGFQLLITGARTLPKWAEESIHSKPEIVFEGFVDNLFERMERCHAAIVPIDVPVGNRSRIVTAMGYGLLVVAHPNTAMGNPDLVSGKTCLLAEAPEEFVECMARAFHDVELATRIEEAARLAYERSFEPHRAGKLLIGQLHAGGFKDA